MIDAAIVGLGSWGRRLVNSVQGVSETIRFVSGVTRTPAKAADFAACHDFTLSDDYEAMLADKAVEAVVLATPHTQHASQIEKAARAGKHVFVEKPFTLSRQSAEEAAKACEDAGITLALGHDRRFQPPVREINRMVTAGELGVLCHIEGNFSLDQSKFLGQWRTDPAETPVGAMTSLGIHIIDAMIHLCGRMNEVSAYSIHRALPFDADDTTSALLRFENGMTGYLGCIGATALLITIRLFGSKGWVEMRDHQTLVKRWTGEEPEITNFEPFDSLRAELESFAGAIEGGAPYPITPGEMIHGVAVLDAFSEALRTGRPAAV